MRNLGQSRPLAAIVLVLLAGVLLQGADASFPGQRIPTPVGEFPTDVAVLPA